MRRLKIKSSKTSLLTITRSPLWIKHMVYILALAEKKFWKYQNGRSRIIYIGTTKTGAGRPAASAVNKASQAFGTLHGVRTLEVHIATCRPRRHLETWRHLEASLLDAFFNRYHQLPKYNKVRPKTKKGLFGYNGLAKITDKFDHAA